MNKNQKTLLTGNCPICEKHCDLNAPQCPRGEAYAASLNNQHMEDNTMRQFNGRGQGSGWKGSGMNQNGNPGQGFGQGFGFGAGRGQGQNRGFGQGRMFNQGGQIDQGTGSPVGRGGNQSGGRFCKRIGSFGGGNRSRCRMQNMWR